MLRPKEFLLRLKKSDVNYCAMYAKSKLPTIECVASVDSTCPRAFRVQPQMVGLDCHRHLRSHHCLAGRDHMVALEPV